MATEVLNALMDVFHSANYRFLTLAEITRQLQRRGVYQNVELHKAMAYVHDHLCNDRASAHYPFFDVEKGGEILWGLEWWFPKRMASSHGRIQSVEPLSVGWETQRTLSPNTTLSVRQFDSYTVRHEQSKPSAPSPA